MAENKPQDPYYYGDVIDLRELIRTLLKHKWIITTATLLAALVAFLVSIFLLSPRYQASAYVTLTEPVVQMDLDTGIQVSPVMPDTEALGRTGWIRLDPERSQSDVGIEQG